MVEEKKRIQWIDLAKGFCIMLVVLQHVSELTAVDYPLSVQAFGFRMPLYFILSGLFFKQYEGFTGFLKRKTNKLLIPFLFFFFVTAVLPYFILLLPDRINLFKDIFTLLYDKDLIMFNSPIWFLLCLFEVNILFYIVQWLARKISETHKTALVLVLSCLIGFTGLMLGVKGLNIVFYIDTAMSVLPFFAFGWWLFRHTHILTSPVNYIRDLIIVIICAVILYYTAVPVKWVVNRITIENTTTVYISGIAGTIMVLMLAKVIGRLPVISYLGRYSIMVLCTHCLFVQVMVKFLGQHLSGMSFLLVVFIASLMASFLLIPFMKRFMPHVTAQKDVIKVP